MTMRKGNVIFAAILLLGLLLVVSAYSTSRIRNKALLDVVPSEQALLAVTVHAPLSLRITAAQSDVVDGLSNGPQAITLESNGKAEIKNNTPYDIEIKQITCTNIGLGRSVDISFSPVIKSGRTQTAEIRYSGDMQDIAGLNTLKLQVKTSWAGGKAAVQFDLPLERIQAPADTPADAESDKAEDTVKQSH